MIANLLIAFDDVLAAHPIDAISIRRWSQGGRSENIVTIDAGQHVYAVAAALGAPPPTDKLDGTKTWLSSRVERDGLVITIIGAWRELRAA